MYRIIFLSIYLLFLSNLVFAQTESRNVPFYSSFSVKRITKNLCKNKESDSLKVRAIYTWITHNIRYDVKAFLRYSEKSYTPNQIIRRRKVVCSGYSALFMNMCLHAGVKCMQVHGYAKGLDYRPGMEFYWDEHAWNSVELNGKWYLMDLTWGSGKVIVKKRKFRKFLFESFGLPYLTNKLKFKQAPNDRYCFTSAQDMLKYHMPAIPAFQLEPYPMTIQAFEVNKNDSSSYAKDILFFDVILDSLKEMSQWDVNLNEAKVGNQFNNKNNRIVGYTYSNYGDHLLKSLPPALKVNPGTQMAISEKAIKYYSEAIPALGRFKSDNATVHRINMDTIGKRNKLVNDNVLQILRSNKRIVSRNIVSLRGLKRRLHGYSQSIYKLNRIHIKMTSDDIQNIQMNNDIKKFKLELIEKWKAEIVVNNSKIRILTDTAFDKTENIAALVDTMNVLAGMANQTYLMNYPIIADNIEFNIKDEMTNALKKNYLVINSNKKLRDECLSKQNSKVLSPLGKEQKQRFNSLSQILKMLSNNKKNLKLIKKMSMEAGKEDQEYLIENSRLFSMYSKTLAYYRERSAFDGIEYSRMLAELGLIKSENKLLKKELKIQGTRYKTDAKKENFRYRLFNQRADRRISICKQGIGMSKRRMVALKKLMEQK